MLEERESYRRKMAGKRLAKLTQANKTAIFGFAEASDRNRKNFSLGEKKNANKYDECKHRK
jgi:hypothetical protein